ncbi:MAG: glycosyltransferase family 4 protein [Myxococcota bacterium]
MTALRIAFVALGFPPDVGGTELYNAEYARQLAARGHDLRLFTWSEGRPAERTADAAFDFPIQRVPLLRVGAGFSSSGLEVWLREVAPDVVFVSRASRLLERVVPVAYPFAPVVVSVHELGGKHTRRGPIGRWRVRRRYGLHGATRIVVNSQNTADRVATLRPNAPIEVVHPGVDTAAFTPDPSARAAAREKLGLGERPVLLTVSRIAANKGHVRVIEAMAQLRDAFPDLLYLIVGTGGEQAALEARAAALGLGSAVRFEGGVPDTREYYRAADCYVMPSGRTAPGKAGEGFGISYVEAGSSGLPVIASASGGGTEIVVDEHTGYLVDPHDVSALAGALRRVLADPERARAMGEVGRERCARFDWERGTDALEATLLRATGRQA